jgi:hypothetical protein
MRINYPERSSFEAPVRRAIQEGHLQVSRGVPVTVRLSPHGYEGSFEVTIDPADLRCFEADWEYADTSRFPARIKAAAKALLAEGQFGKFTISHAHGVLEIRRGDVLPPSTH